jgi:integrase
MAPRKRKAERRARRKPGTGTIRYKKGRELPYEAAFPIGHNQHRYDYFATETEAGAHLDQLYAESRDKDKPRDIAAGSQRAETFLISWLNIKRPHIKEKTFHDYQYQVVLACEQIGTMRMDEVSDVVADNLLLYFHGRGYNNVGQMHMVLKQAFNYALKKAKCIKSNPFDGAEVPPVVRRQSIALTRTERAALFAVIVGHPMEALFHLYARLGFRKGEGLGVRWCDIDWERKTIAIEQQYTNIEGRTVKSTPKTKRSRRLVPAPDDILDMLRLLRPKVYERRLRAGPDWQDNDLVFPSEVGTPISPRNVLRFFKSALKRAGLREDVNIHDLRHTALSLLETSGVPQSARMALAGHTSAAMSRHYIDHAELEAVRAAIEKIA